MFKPADPISLGVFLLIVLGILVAVLLGTFVSRPSDSTPVRRPLSLFLALFSWLSLLAFIVEGGFMEAKPMPRVLLFMGSANLLAVLFSLSSYGKDLARNISLPFLIAFQGFRFPLEIVLHAWVNEGVIPGTMTWTGSNLDIVIGVSALMLAPFVADKKGLAWVFNSVGLLSLMNVMRVAVFSSPLPFSWKVSPPLELVFHVPYFLIVPVCIGGALAGHLILARKLLGK